ncbi:MAG: methyltransferase [Hyphomicrobiaceae bacterium]|nr:methyltransferase [Hyphomicrobiaceae bacterium]
MAAAFGRKAATYDANAELQAQVAARLSEYLPKIDAPRVLEIGCGTGLLTGHLLSAYRDGNFLITDIAPQMVERCRRKFARSEDVRFAVANAQIRNFRGPFDLIASSMVMQWFDDARATLKKLADQLAPGGLLLYATTGEDNLAEWSAALQAAKLPPGRPSPVGLPGIASEERIVIDYGSTRDFLRSLKAIGANSPSANFRSSSSTARLRFAIRLSDARAHGRMTWHIVYGRIDAENE